MSFEGLFRLFLFAGDLGCETLSLQKPTCWGLQYLVVPHMMSDYNEWAELTLKI